MSEPAPPPRFRLIPAVWAAGHRLGQRWSPLFAIAICLVGLPNALVAAAYAGQAADWGGLIVGALSGAVLSGLANGAFAWLALADGEDSWRVGTEGLGRAFYKLSPLAGLVLLLNLPALAYTALLILTRGDIPWTQFDGWIWWVAALLVAIIPTVMAAFFAPIAGLLMFEGGDLRPAIGRAMAMTRGSRPKLLAVEIVRVLTLQAASYGLGQLPAVLDGASAWGLWALVNALIAAMFALISNQAYMQLHDAEAG